MPQSQKPLVVVGSINLDFVSRPQYLPLPGETVFSKSFATHPGGKGANQAVAAAKLEYPVFLIGRVGSDPFGEHLRESLSGAGVNVDHVLTTPGPSGAAMIAVADSGENNIVVTPGANQLLSPADIEDHSELLKSAGVVLTQLETPMETLEALATLCSKASVPLILDPAPAQPLPRNVLRSITWFTPNQTEASVLRGAHPATEEDVESILHAMLGLGVSGVILKRGEDGAMLANQSGFRFRQPAFPVASAVDTTAAGDAFNGAFAVAWMEGFSPEESARFAAAAASICVSKPGAQEAMPTRSEVMKMLAATDR